MSACPKCGYDAKVHFRCCEHCAEDEHHDERLTDNHEVPCPTKGCEEGIKAVVS